MNLRELMLTVSPDSASSRSLLSSPHALTREVLRRKNTNNNTIFMPLDRENIKQITGKELDDKIVNLKLLIGISEKRDENFLTVKLGITAFVGVVFTVAFGNQKNFSRHFLITLSIITTFLFLLLIYEFWRSFRDIEKTLEKQNRRVILAHARNIAALENPSLPNFEIYAKNAEKFLVEEDKLRTSMLNGIPLEEIIKKEKLTNGCWQFNYALWSLLFLSVPMLMLLGILGAI